MCSIKLYMKYRIVAISGALEEESPLNDIAKKFIALKTELQIELLDIKNVPLLNVDLYQNQFPPSIEFIRKKIKNCDGLIFLIPEFFGKVSPAFKNIFDWLSYSPNADRPSPIRGMSACMISFGDGDCSLVQKHLLQMSQFCRMKIMNKPCLHYTKEQLNSLGKNWQNSAGKELQELQSFLDYFGEFLSKKLKK